METTLTEFVKSDSKPALHLPVMKHPQRQFTHELAELFDLRSESLDEEPRRRLVIFSFTYLSLSLTVFLSLSPFT